MSKAIVMRTEIDERFLIEHNPKVSRINHETVTVLGNTPVSVGYSVAEQTGAGTTINFPIKMSETSFVDSCVRLEMEIPVKFNLNATGGSEGTAFLALKSLEDVCVKQFGLMNAINTIQLRLNGSTISTVSDVHSRFPAIAQYYDAATALKLFPQSLPDSYTSYEQYDGSSVISTVDVSGRSMPITTTQYYPLNIFDNVNSYEFNSRRPYVSNLVKNGTTVTGIITLSTFVPFSIFTLPSSEGQSMYGINEMAIQFTLRDQWVKHLFGIRKPTGYTINSIDVDSSYSGGSTARLYYKEYSPPSYIESNMIENGRIKPYRIAMSDLFEAPVVDTGSIASLGLKEFNSNQISLGSLPSKIYIYAVPKEAGSETPETLAQFYGRIENLTLNVGSATTPIQGLERIYQTCIENDLSVQRDVGFYTNGFAVCLDLTKDVSIGKDALIGLNLPVTISIKGLVRNLSTVARNYEMRFQCVFPSQLVYSDRKFQLMTTLLTDSLDFGEESIIKHLYDNHDMTLNQVIIGGSIFGSIFRGLKNIGRYVVNNPEKVLNFAKNAYKTITGSGNRQSNIIGGTSSTSRTLLLGSGTTSGGIFK